MLLLTCPCCGVSAEETEFVGGGEAHLKRAGPEASEAEFEAYLFERRNPKGVHLERWRHAYGCGKWFHLARDTATLEIFGSYAAQASAPPKEVLEAMRARRPGWEAGR
jgi:sarcosine oxidase subunit delta